ncbi:MAG: DUF444 family protein [Myxococcales bacterium]|nr:DUF444 family protein [Myxococcales bacterium]
MSQRIDLDHGRFREIIRGKIKENLRKYVSQGEMIARKGNDTVSVPIPQVDLPRFRFGSKEQQGVGQGDGKVGQGLGDGDPQDGDGHGEASDRPGEHMLDVDLSVAELAEILGEELALPRIEPKGNAKISTYKDKYSGIRSTGPESLRHFRRTYKQALRRQVGSSTYDGKNPVIIPIRDDRRYRSWKREMLPQSTAVIIYMMDVSGSMGDEQKEIVRIESFWLDTWLRSQYKGIESRYIIHDALAKEVDRDTFFRTRESGGTMISSAYKLCAKMIEDDYPVDQWNIYPFHFSDGDNWSVDDTAVCVSLLRDELLAKVNMFGYGQVESPYGSGQFLKDLNEQFGADERVVTSEIKSKDAILDSIKDFLGKGK